METKPYNPRNPFNKTDLELAEVIGNVHQVMQTCFKAHQKADMIIQGKMLNNYSGDRKNIIITFNEKGKKTHEQFFGYEGSTTNLFNEKGLESEITKYTKDGKLEYKTTFTYNAKGLMLDAITTNAEGTVTRKHINKYREDGKMLELTQYNANEIFDTQVLYTYNDDGNLVSGIQRKADGSIVYETHYKYNEQGKEIEHTWEYTDKKMSDYNSRQTKKYNTEGDCVELAFYKPLNAEPSMHYYTHEYDSEGKRIEPERVPYDPYAKAVGETEELENDAKGNWIKKTTYINKIPTMIYQRSILYFGDAAHVSTPVENDGGLELFGKTEGLLIHPLSCTINIDNSQRISDSEPNLEELTEEQAQWLTERIVSPEQFAVHRYYALQFKEAASVITYTGPNIEALALLHELKENMEAQIIHSYNTNWNGHGERLIHYTLSFSGKPYILHAMQLTSDDEEEFDIPDEVKRSYHHYNDDGNVYTSQFQLLMPSDASGNRDDYFEEELNEYIQKCMLLQKPDKPTINMIEQTATSFTMEEHAVSDDFEIKDLDVNYGYGFEKFHNQLMQRFNNDSKGLVLFHGLPGTGKTFYIRHLLRKMASSKKIVIYMPPNMVDHLVEPAFMTFLSGEVKRYSQSGHFCVLLIEDAEPLLAKRQEGVRIQGVTNLLNMSDGLLNDMLNMQIICTFNVDLKRLDSALLRPGRLIARKEFKPLSELDANLLAKRLGIKHHFKKQATLGEIYALLKDKNTLIHDVEPDRDASKNIDDL